MTEYELTSGTTADGAVTNYTYELKLDEADQTPHAASDPGNIYLHADLGSITDPNGSKYVFTYNVDNTKLNYMSNPDLYTGYYVQSGQPRNVSTITMPDDHTISGSGTDVATFVNDSKVWIQFDSAGHASQQGRRHIKVTDATGFLHTYRFEDAVVIPIPQLGVQYNSSSFTDSKMICYQTMSLDYGNATSGTYMGTETYQFDISAAMAIMKITDFSGNVTTFTHSDTWSDPTYMTLMPTTTTYPGLSGSVPFNGYYGDPTSQTNALGQAKSFSYEPVARIMTDVTDEDGHHTHYDIDSLQRVVGDLGLVA